ncbi:hypothetical protein, partial [Flavobacterium sp.]|uniref:hypothetical protein n=1 Tax=Flavobacterium sp. TaxID=239 RepID=UPI002619F860
TLGVIVGMKLRTGVNPIVKKHAKAAAKELVASLFKKTYEATFFEEKDPGDFETFQSYQQWRRANNKI